MKEEIDALLEAQTRLAEHVMHMDRVMYLQRAMIIGLRDYVVETSGTNREEAMQRLSRLARQSYDRVMLSIGDTNPGYAEQIDIRPTLPDGDTDFWMFP